MAKINHEEYKLLKSLEDQWKWIARDDDLSVYDDKPVKVHSAIPCWDISTEKNEWQRINRSLFQFIQWEDEEPYNIQELIEEYESEGTDIEWLISEIDQRVEAHKETNPYNNGVAIGLRSSLFLINQLDEPEITLNEAFNKLEETHILSKEEIVKHFEQLVIHNGKVTYGDYETLSQEWIEQKSIDTHVDALSGEIQVTFRLDDLQNLLMPKQEGLEAKIQELIEVYKREDGDYGSAENGWISGFIEDLENLLEEKQMYYVLNSEGETMIRKSDSGVGTSSGFKIKDWNWLNNESYKLTEQEIKDYDERYFAFAVKVEELEEDDN